MASLSRLFASNQNAPKLSLRIVFVVPFLLQIFASVGLTGWLSFRNGSIAVNDLATQLRIELSNRIQQELHTYLETPHIVNQINVDTLKMGLINLNNTSQMERYLWNQLQQFQTASYIGIGLQNGYYIGANRNDDGTIEFDIVDQRTSGKFEKWLTNNQGDRSQLLSVRENYDPRVRPWYKAGVKAGKAVWSEIYAYFGSRVLVISANQPIYNQKKQLLGVASTDLTLERISQFLNSLKIGKTGQTFVMEKNGYLVATSTLEETFIVNAKKEETERIKAVNSSNPLTQATSRYLVEHFGNLDQIQQSTQLTFEINGKHQYLQVTPLSDQRGINWLIVVVVPESDFMAEIHANNQTTILLCLVALFVATLCGIYTARWISTPILRLSQASQAIASGELDQTIPVESIQELGILANSFNTMTQQLKASFHELEKTNAELEQRVEERTADLRLEKERSEQLLLNILPEAIAEQLKQDTKAIASAIEEVTILFADIVGFTPLSSKVPPIELVGVLNEMFSIFDNLAEHNGLEKIKTIGDAYMVVGGLPLPKPNHAEAIADMALGMQAAMSQFQAPLERFNIGSQFQIRIGINTGSVVAGVIGIKKFIYDLWGDAVNIASRMESSGEPGRIQVTEATYERIKDQYNFEKRGKISIKGKGEMTTYWLVGKK
ncbi:adenylate/guanylate cyclase domain-containing protein [Planktothrix sp. FACHB-1365]|uniref:adenylate/guanylate cyclase domain-containing protein n=1 Tax=Planktothrix sp. FACHB-1365 TaxID=2692855 RepID=UPI001688A27D|nr:adenylate/guanylate cyclase domain-containing protein [Planktothrix sp. FACHB-1365]MBD2483117.1 HAMP domain-containing protein [Planktothrix sp. FACHB-1365]